MKSKSEIIGRIVIEMNNQREALVNELASMNYNENCSMDKKIAIESQLNNIDAQINNVIMQLIE